MHRKDSSSAKIFLVTVVLGAVMLLIYWPAWHGGFLWDDDRYLTHNALLTAPDGFRRIWFSLDAPSQYFPLSYTVLRLERALWGLDPTGYHWVNILLHGLAHPCAAEHSRVLVGSFHLRLAPGSGGISRLDFRAEKCPDGIFLFIDAAHMDRTRRCNRETPAHLLSRRAFILLARAVR